MSCRIQRTNEWSIRLLHESFYHEDNCFLTLTYDDEFLPKGGTLVKSHVQKFFKRLRKRLGLKIKYYAVGEYGEETERPHYHAVIFGWYPGEVKSILNGKGFTSTLVSEIWPYGFNVVGTVERKSINYVTGYVRKKLYGKLAVETYGMRCHPFLLCSQGLGKQYALDNERGIKDDLGVVHRGVNVGLPRYYAKILRVSNESLRFRSLEAQADLFERYVVTEGYDPGELLRLVEGDRYQRSKNVQARQNLLGASRRKI